MDHGHRELLASEPTGYGAVSTLERPRDLGFDPVFGVPEDDDFWLASNLSQRIRQTFCLSVGIEPPMEVDHAFVLRRFFGPAASDRYQFRL